MGIIGTAQAAIGKQFDKLADAADRTAKMGMAVQSRGNDETDLVDDAVTRIESSAAVKANLTVIKTADQLYGTLLDMYL